VPGVQTTPTLPPGACHTDWDCNSADLMCDVTATTGAVCTCNAESGSETCTRYSSCVRTPCAVCSDCLTHMSAFTVTQLYNQNSASIATAFSSYCNSTRTWTATQCNTAAAAVAANKPSFGKRAGNLCQAVGVCNAPNAVPMAAGCMLKVSTPATVDRVARTLTPAPLDNCAVEGLQSGVDVPGTTRSLILPTGVFPLCFHPNNNRQFFTACTHKHCQVNALQCMCQPGPMGMLSFWTVAAAAGAELLAVPP
jgi:hypothetical protein